MRLAAPASLRFALTALTSLTSTFTVAVDIVFGVRSARLRRRRRSASDIRAIYRTVAIDVVFVFPRGGGHRRLRGCSRCCGCFDAIAQHHIPWHT